MEKQENDTEAEKSRIIQTAARLVQNHIESIEANTSTYPSSVDLEIVWTMYLTVLWVF